MLVITARDHEWNSQDQQWWMDLKAWLIQHGADPEPWYTQDIQLPLTSEPDCQ